jgi:hypothetical protein
MKVARKRIPEVILPRAIRQAPADRTISDGIQTSKRRTLSPEDGVDTWDALIGKAAPAADDRPLAFVLVRG